MIPTTIVKLKSSSKNNDLCLGAEENVGVLCNVPTYYVAQMTAENVMFNLRSRYER